MGVKALDVGSLSGRSHHVPDSLGCDSIAPDLSQPTYSPEDRATSKVLHILKSDPYNTTRSHPIKKLEGVKSGDAEYRIRVGRWRFRYDVIERTVYLKACSLRREDTY